MKKNIIIFLAVALVVGGAYFVIHKVSINNVHVSESLSDISTWETYHNTEYGFSIKYPPKYVVEEGLIATSTPWAWRSLMTIFDSTKTLAGEFARAPVQVSLEKQPVKYKGQVFHTIDEYYKSRVLDEMIQGLEKPTGKLVVVNGIKSITYHYLPGDAEEVSSDVYYFIKNDLIYEFSFDASDLYQKGMLGSITWQ